MTLQNFMKMHQDGCVQDCVTILQLPFSHILKKYKKTYFEEESQVELAKTELFKEIKNMQVDHFNIIGGGKYNMELRIYLKVEEKVL